MLNEIEYHLILIDIAIEVHIAPQIFLKSPSVNMDTAY